MTNKNQNLFAGSTRALDQMKMEIAQEFGVNLGADTSARLNGAVGGEMVKRMIAFAEQQLAGK